MTLLAHRPAATLALLASLTLPALGGGLAGCSAAQDAARGAADQATSAAAAKATEAMVSLVTQQVCALVGDGLSGTDLATMKQLLAQVASIGIPSQVLTEAKAITNRGTATADQVAALKKSCAAT